MVKNKVVNDDEYRWYLTGYDNSNITTDKPTEVINSVSGNTKKIDHEYLSLPEMLADFHEWMHWKIMPGW